MNVTAEVSLYPLCSDYEAPIIDFIKNLKANKNLTVLTHSMSTYIKGDIAEVMSTLGETMKSIDEPPSSLVIKLITRDLPVEIGFLEF